MANFDFSNVEAVLIDPQTNTRRIIRQALSRLHITHVQEFESVDDMGASIERSSPDLLLIDIDGPDNPGLRTISQIRHGNLYRNPFINIVASTWNPTSQLVAKITNSGADLLLLKPISLKLVEDRLIALVGGRLPFVVTSDYIGPDRRQTHRAGEGKSAPVTYPPNTLRFKATGEIRNIDLEAEIVKAQSKIDEQKILSNVFQIMFLIEFALPGLRKDVPDPISLEHICRLPIVVADTLKRVTKGPMSSHFEQAGQSLIESVEAMRDAAPHSLEELRDLRSHGQKLFQLANPDSSLDDLMAMVTPAVVGYTKRVTEFVAAKRGL